MSPQQWPIDPLTGKAFPDGRIPANRVLPQSRRFIDEYMAAPAPDRLVNLPAVDHVVYIAHGQVAVGTPEDVITTETLSRLYTTPIEVLRASDGGIVVVGQPEEEVCYHAGLHR